MIKFSEIIGINERLKTFFEKVQYVENLDDISFFHNYFPKDSLLIRSKTYTDNFSGMTEEFLLQTSENNSQMIPVEHKVNLVSQSEFLKKMKMRNLVDPIYLIILEEQKADSLSVDELNKFKKVSFFSEKDSLIKFNLILNKTLAKSLELKNVSRFHLIKKEVPDKIRIPAGSIASNCTRPLRIDKFSSWQNFGTVQKAKFFLGLIPNEYRKLKINILRTKNLILEKENIILEINGRRTTDTKTIFGDEFVSFIVEMQNSRLRNINNIFGICLKQNFSSDFSDFESANISLHSLDLGK